MPLKVGSQVTNTPTEECQECVVIPCDLLWPIAYFYFEGEIKGIRVLGKSTARIRSQTFIAIQQIYFFPVISHNFVFNSNFARST